MCPLGLNYSAKHENLQFCPFPEDDMISFFTAEQSSLSVWSTFFFFSSSVHTHSSCFCILGIVNSASTERYQYVLSVLTEISWCVHPGVRHLGHVVGRPAWASLFLLGCFVGLREPSMLVSIMDAGVCIPSHRAWGPLLLTLTTDWGAGLKSCALGSRKVCLKSCLTCTVDWL